MQMAMGER